MLQIVTRRKPRLKRYVRAVPYTAIAPTKAQIDVRVRFARIARLAKGMKFMNGLPPAAQLVKEQMHGYRSPYRIDKLYRKKWFIELLASRRREIARRIARALLSSP